MRVLIFRAIDFLVQIIPMNFIGQCKYKYRISRRQNVKKVTVVGEKYI